MNIRSAFVLSLGIVVAAAVLGGAFLESRRNDVITASGSARKSVASDTVVWRCSFSRSVLEKDIALGHEQMDADWSIVRSFLQQKGLKDGDIDAGPIFMNKEYRPNNVGPQKYSLRRSITISSKDVPGVTEMAKNTRPVVEQGVFLSTNSLEYYYSGLAEDRVQLLAAAVENARERAAMIAESGGMSIGSVKSARQGVVQVLRPHSTNVAGYGTYDTSTIEKEVMVTVRAEFRID
jgi:hypothetical protein